MLQNRKNAPVPVDKIKEPERDKNSIENKLKYLLREKQKKTIIRPICQTKFYLSEKINMSVNIFDFFYIVRCKFFKIL